MNGVWCIRSSAAQRVKLAFKQLLLTLNSLTDDSSVRADSHARIRGLQRQAQSSKLYFGISLCVQIFCPCEDLAKSLQGKSVIAYGAVEAANKFVDTLTAQREDERITDVIMKCIEESEQMGLKLPVQGRNVKTPQ